MTGAHILVVEDDRGLLGGIRSVLELDNYRVQTAEHGRQALAILHETSRPPDLIVSDIMMPHMDGLQLLQEVRKEARWLNIPFIFLTARGEKSDVQQGKLLGVDDYLIKPFEASDLLIAIESRLNRHRALNNAHADTITTLKRNILTILNHEFRTPLTYVVAYSDMLNGHDTLPLNEEELLAFLKGIGTGARRLRRLIENFILLVELETGDAQRTFEWRKSMISSLYDLLQEAVSRVRELNEVRQSCSIRLANDIPPFTADREYLMIALEHLITNAVRFSPANKPVVIGAHREGRELHLWVQDEGRGIPPAELDNIWDIFYQVNRAKHEDQGAGSGLAIVRRIAQMHGGRAEVMSEVGVGSCFTLILPL